MEKLRGKETINIVEKKGRDIDEYNLFQGARAPSSFAWIRQCFRWASCQSVSNTFTPGRALMKVKFAFDLRQMTGEVITGTCALVLKNAAGLETGQRL